jgi:DUF1680 family protein
MMTMLRSLLAGLAAWLLLDLPWGQAGDYPLEPVPFHAVELRAGLWGQRLQKARQVTVWAVFQRCQETGRIDNFAVAGGLKKGRFRGIFFDDSDVFKALEGAAYLLALERDPKLEALVDQIIGQIAAAQEEDGYLYTARTINDPEYDFPGKREGRWARLDASHELYNVGHLYEAAVAYYQATGKRDLLDVACRNADLVCRVFGAGPDQRRDVDGHPEIELALVRLYRLTGQKRYLEQAKFFLDIRGRADLRPRLYGPYCQDHAPVVAQSTAVGHAVRLGYLFAAAVDVGILTDEPNYLKAAQQVWKDIVSSKIYVTGGVGARAAGEAFGEPYELPNATAYNETCAAIAQVLLHHRLFLATGHGQYMDVLERILYNGFLSGVSLEGDTFFYPNPLAWDGKSPFNHGVPGRSPWFACACCPVNIVRFLPSILGYFYATREDTVFVNLYESGAVTLQLRGKPLRLLQQTEYPWEGRIRVMVETGEPVAMELRLRVPGWARHQPLPSDLYRYVDSSSQTWRVSVNGEAIANASLKNGYVCIRRTWQSGDFVELYLPMPVRRVEAHPKVADNVGRMAIERGPIVYCVEGIDHAGSVQDLVVPLDAQWSSYYERDVLGGVVVLRCSGIRLRQQPDGTLRNRTVRIQAIPYYAWSHRGPSEMLVWLPWDPARAQPSRENGTDKR